ncbi:EAL domain-containing protein [Siccirubricoccus sp. KC 17139]|uniref:EAL domain-containing protein n=1 Tax=Siccirubricoccus soli TaxID=2899147 RepID=A0ABT1D625_9PROT|nr:EAL domain-containing protein [Siccirubricoccus soli]MCO6417047.1 EAL domain-containing protein [Siccirubricoccus soli]MCP2683182.1 EAL domain-containing protein [Siccirubricoccus soli]
MVVESGREALARIAAPGVAPRHLVCDPLAAGADWPNLLALLRDPGAPTGLVVVSSSPDRGNLPGDVVVLPADPLRLAAALLARPASASALPDAAAAALEASLARGEIAVRFQPVVSLRDRRPILVEALARWHLPDAPVRPDAFVALAERAGLARKLSIAVASRAGAELARLAPGFPALGLSLNLPLALLLQPDLVAWLGRAMAGTGFGPGRLFLELTETTEVRDRRLLLRALQRLNAAGYRVLLDDLALGDGREGLLALPFAGFKLDRSLVERLPREAAVRHAVRRLIGLARRRGQMVIAEGVGELGHWSLLRGLGLDSAQGFGIGRPLPASALPTWLAGWRGYRRG